MPPVFSTPVLSDDAFILSMLKFFRELPQFFKGLEEIIIYGGFLRDYISKTEAADVDIRIVGNISNFIEREDGRYESVLKDYFMTWLVEDGFEVKSVQTNLVQFQKSDYGSSEPCISTKTSELKSEIITPQELLKFLKEPVKAISEHFELVFKVIKKGIEYVLKFDISMFETPLEKNQTIADVDSLYLRINRSTNLPEEHHHLRNWVKMISDTFSPSHKKKTIMNHLKNMKMQLTSCVDEKSIPRITKMIGRGWKFSNMNQKKNVHSFLSSLLATQGDSDTIVKKDDNLLDYEKALHLIDEKESIHEKKTQDSDESDDSDDESYDSFDSYDSIEDGILEEQDKLSSFKAKSKEKKEPQRKQNKLKKKK